MLAMSRSCVISHTELHHRYIKIVFISENPPEALLTTMLDSTDYMLK